MYPQLLANAPLLARDVLLVVLGVLVGGVLQVVVARILAYLRRRAVTQALMQDVRNCARTAFGVQQYLQQKVIPEWEKGLFSTSSPQLIDTNFWEKALQDIDQLPRQQLARLISFYQFAGAINRAVGVITGEQDILTSKYMAEGSHGDGFKRLIRPIQESVLRNAKQAAQMYASMASVRSIESLAQIPDDMFEFRAQP